MTVRPADAMMNGARTVPLRFARSNFPIPLLAQRWSLRATLPAWNLTGKYGPYPFPGRLQDRSYSSQGSSNGASVAASQASDNLSTKPEQQPSYLLRFTCKPCKNTSTHTISKQGYHHGTVLITCPSCQRRHVMSDHLRIFSDEKITIEDIMKRKGGSVTKGALNKDGDLEWWA